MIPYARMETTVGSDARVGGFGTCSTSLRLKRAANAWPGGSLGEWSLTQSTLSTA